MVEAISELTTGQLTGGIALLSVGISAILEISPIRLNPWSLIARKIGRAINGEVIEKVEKLEKEIKDMKESQEERDAKAARTRVLRFGDELIHDVKHTKEHFDDILQDMSDYEKYCEEHKDFKNDRMHLTSQHIKETYHRCMEEHSFL